MRLYLRVTMTDQTPTTTPTFLLQQTRFLKILALIATSFAALTAISVLLCRHYDDNSSFINNINDYHEADSTHRFLLTALPTSHKSLLPLSTSDYLGFFFAALGLLIAAGGGIGGGGVLVPIYILVMGFSPKSAIPLSNVTVLGGAIANVILNLPKRHPLADRPLVDWDLILLMEPLTIGGALIGAVLNKLLPELLLTVLLVLLLGFTSYETLGKAVKMYKKETQAMIKSDSSHKSTSVENVQNELTRLIPEKLEIGEETSDLNTTTFNSASEVIKNKEILSEILEEERYVPIGNVRVLVISYTIVLFINVMKGGGAFASPFGIQCGSFSFWMSNAIMIGWVILVSTFARSHLVKRNVIKERVGYVYVEGDIKWDERATILYPSVCTTAGFFAGMFGVGGGIVKGPLMLAMGIHPKVASATSACMILFTSFTATTSYVVFGLLEMDYGLALMITGLVTTSIGQLGLSILMSKFKRNSFIAFSIGGIVLLSTILMTMQNVMNIVKEGGSKQANGICVQRS